MPLEYYEINQDELWKDNELMFEQGFNKAKFHPYYHYKSSQVTTRYFNIDEKGLRKTIKAPKEDAKKIFMFGGSTLWGLGVADKYTIPSIMSEKLGKSFDITNFGEGSFVSGQELNLLLDQISKGNIPDAVIFYDGVNDSYAGTYSPGIPGTLTQHLEMEKVYKSLQGGDNLINGFSFIRAYIREKLRKISYWKIASYLKNKYRNLSDHTLVSQENINFEIDVKAEKVINIYAHRIKQIKAISKEYDFKAYFFWQPYLMSNIKKPVTFEQKIVDSKPPKLIKGITRAYDFARTHFEGQEAGNIYFIADIFKDVEHPVYMDDCHVDARGNKIIASKIIALLHEKLGQL